MKHLFFLGKGLLAAALTLLCLPASADDLDRIKHRFLETVWTDFASDSLTRERFLSVSDHGLANDAVMHQIYVETSLPEAEIARLTALFDPETGRWTDIDYADLHPGRWHPSLHVMRLCALAKEYTRPGSRHRGDTALQSLLHAGLKGWLTDTPVCPNWWSNEIGVPKRMGAFLLMMESELTEEEREGGVRVMEGARLGGKTGQNLLWVAGNQLMKGLLLNDYAWVADMQQEIAGLICLSSGEGLREDGSFHQHGPMVQFGNYGLAFLDGIAFWMRVFSGTSLDFNPDQKALFRWYADDGIGWCFYQGTMDTNFRGRHLFPDSGEGKWLAFQIARANLDACGLGGVDDREGGRYFPLSDCGIYRARNWYASIRMHSRRTIGFEFTNRENMGGYFSADGALLLLRDGTEYENIFPVWDWRKIPGTTTYEDGKPLRTDDSREAKCNRTDHVGGAVSGDVLCTTMELERDGLHALKSAFFFPGGVVNLGADIRGSRSEMTAVTTSVEQNHLDLKSFRHKKRYACHRKTGYVSLDGKPLSVTVGIQSGPWSLLEPSLSDEKVSKPVFKCWIDQETARWRGEGDTYAYAILPGRSVWQTILAAFLPPVKVLSNTAACQAVRWGRSVGIVFHEPGELRIGRETVRADIPSIVILTPEGERRTQLPEKTR